MVDYTAQVIPNRVTGPVKNQVVEGRSSLKKGNTTISRNCSVENYNILDVCS